MSVYITYMTDLGTLDLGIIVLLMFRSLDQTR